jgi:hypothetical protein
MTIRFPKKGDSQGLCLWIEILPGTGGPLMILLLELSERLVTMIVISMKILQLMLVMNQPKEPVNYGKPSSMLCPVGATNVEPTCDALGLPSLISLSTMTSWKRVTRSPMSSCYIDVIRLSVKHHWTFPLP